MNTSEWSEYFKIEDGLPCPTNMVYVPLMNPDKSILCMDFGNSRIKFDNQMFFEREIEYLTMFKDYSWAPTVFEIDSTKKQIFIEWNKETLNNIIYTNRNISDLSSNWREQLRTIVRDIIDAGVYKLTIYPHCFYIDKQGIMRTTDFYASVSQDNPIVSVEQINSIIGIKSAHRWKEAIVNNTVNFKIFFENAINNHVMWPEDALKDLL